MYRVGASNGWSLYRCISATAVRSTLSGVGTVPNPPRSTQPETLFPYTTLFRSGRHEPAYRRHVGERYGRYATAVQPPVLWLHAVSLGETRAAAPLVERLHRAYPDATLLITHMTATGRAAGRALFGDGVIQADRKSTRLNSSHLRLSRMPSSA